MRPDAIYRNTLLWIPKTSVPKSVVTNGLTVYDQQGNSIIAYKENETHYGVPRAWMREEEVEELDAPIIDETPEEYEPTSIISRITLDAQGTGNIQQDAFMSLMLADGGILNLRCGIGKTVIALHTIANMDVPALVINDKVHILKQWKEEALKHLKIKKGDIGWIQGKPEKWKWKRPLTLASLTTLAKYADSVTDEMARYYGVIFWDEVHHLAARQFSKTADMFYGKRFGLTATVRRADGLEVLYLWHLGGVLQRVLENEMKPEVVVVKSPTNVDFTEAYEEITDIRGEIHIQKLCTYVGTRKRELRFVKSVLEKLIEEDRDILCLSVSKQQIVLLHKAFPNSGIIHADIPVDDRLNMLDDNKLTFATVQIAREALNKKSLDTLVVLTEFSSQQNLQQAVGRILRKYGDKKPKVVIIGHPNVGPMAAMQKKMLKHLRSWGML